MVGRCDTAKRRHSLPVEIAGHFIQHIIVVVIEKAGIKRKCQILELPRQPVIPFGILPLKTHAHRLGCVLHGQGQRHHCSVTRQIPLGLFSLLVNIQLLKREEQRQVILGWHGFLSDKMILRQIYGLIVHERRRGGQSGQKTQQPITADKSHNCLSDLSLSLAVHLQSPYI